jgi:hypothetical protein
MLLAAVRNSAGVGVRPEYATPLTAPPLNPKPLLLLSKGIVNVAVPEPRLAMEGSVLRAGLTLAMSSVKKPFKG